MSFIDLLGDDVWTDADIAKRVDSMTLSAYPDRQVLERDELFVGNGHVPPGQQGNERARFGQYVAHCQQMRQLAKEAKADMDLLNEAMAVEHAQKVLSSIPDAPEFEEIRAPYEETIANASPEALELVEIRAAARPPELIHHDGEQ